ncbi:MAG: hypothetical protein ACRENB_11145 [Gemmatimonadales bacterium]
MRALRGIAAIALLSGAGCAQTFDATSLGVPVSMGNAPGEAAQGAAFRTTGHSYHAFFGLFTLSQANLQKALASQLVGGQQVSRVKITTKSRWFDVVITGLTLGIVVPRTVIYEGIVTGAPPQ